jgi:hypothetical protein
MSETLRAYNTLLEDLTKGEKIDHALVYLDKDGVDQNTIAEVLEMFNKNKELESFHRKSEVLRTVSGILGFIGTAIMFAAVCVLLYLFIEEAVSQIVIIISILSFSAFWVAQYFIKRKFQSNLEGYQTFVDLDTQLESIEAD